MEKEQHSKVLQVNEILKRYEDSAELQDFCNSFSQMEKGKSFVGGLAGSQAAFLLSAMYRQTKKSTIIILDDKEEALYFLNDMKNLMPRKEILYFPASYRRPYQIEEIDNANVLQRAEVLNQINHTKAGRHLIVTFAEALSERVINRRSLLKNTLEIKKGDDCGMDFVTDVLEEYHFVREDFVSEPGQFAIRGGILDVFSFANEMPYRIEFFGDEIDSIRIFDPVEQISVDEVTHVSLIPNIQKNLIEEEKVDFLDFITDTAQIFVKNASFVSADLDKQFQRAEKFHTQLIEQSGGAATSSDPTELYTSGTTFKTQLEGFPVLEFGSRPVFNPDLKMDWKGTPQPAFIKEFKLLTEHLTENQDQKIENFVFSENEKQFIRLEEIFDELTHRKLFTGVKADIHRGFLDQKLKMACYSDHEIFERYHKYKTRAQTSRSQALTLKELKELNPGDYVTHVTHGIGKFAGLHRIKVGESEQEAIKIIYRNDDAIFVNVNSLYKVTKYAGKDGEVPKLSKLGSQEWARSKAKAKKRIKEIAFDLIELYAKRHSKKGFAFTHDSYLQQELEASFMYEDTPDQLKCTEDVKADMEKTVPMDRLICGDVGFGKTEIAIRAAFKAATDGKQVAVLVPTTILAVQHYHTFKDRLKDLPVTVDYLNRFKSAKEQKETLKNLEEGKVDIVIGTHRLVSKDVKFKDLGLLVIDEEQKFGVGVKDKLKTIKVNVDTLTLTATPIPRTMQFSLMGVRDLSVIATPPPNRQPVETVVAGLEPALIRDAIAYELKRGGQVFFIHNRINDLEEIANMIKKLVPDARIAIAHGQLTGAKMEKVMSDFIEGDYDVLVCTTIVESGLDIPNANTIIINQAQNFGLSDLHQMRGRVGRSNRKAFCYLLAPDETVLTPDARRRLKAIEEFSDLGSGFHIALRDLDIRGAGDILGPEQSGFIAEIGYDTYHKILEEAILELKEEYYPELFAAELQKRKENLVEDCQVDTDLNIMISEQYLPGVSERLQFYNRIAAAETEEDLRKIMREMQDRFGPVPESVLMLFDTVRIRKIGRQLGFEKVVLKSNTLRLYFVSDKTSPFFSSPAFVNILAFAQSYPAKAKLKESPKYLSLVLPNVEGTKGILMKMREIQDFVKEMDAQETTS